MPQFRITQLIFSFFVSLLFIWMAGYFFCDSLVYYQYDNTLKKFIHAPNTLCKYHSEGMGTTYKGLYGINAIPDITKIKKNKIVVWGDSYVEGLQVNDRFKLTQVVSKMFSQKGLGKQLMCFGVGMGGDSVADYYFDIPKYEKIVSGIKAHFIIITDFNDALPDRADDNMRGIFSSQPFRLHYDEWTPEFQGVKKTLDGLNMYFIWDPMKSLISSVKKIQLLPSVQAQSARISRPEKTKLPKEFLMESWTFLLKKLDSQTNLPIIFVYCPSVPRIEKGKVSFVDTDYNYFLLFAKVAALYGIPVINVGNDFLSLFKTHGLFPRGFSNSIPGEGHFNENGHRIVAQAITDYVIAEVGK